MKPLFKKNEEILRVKNIVAWGTNIQIIKEKVYSCGLKQIILKDEGGNKGEKIDISYYKEYELDFPFFKVEKRNLAEILKQKLNNK